MTQAGESFESCRDLGRRLAGQGRFAEAAQQLEAALRRRPNDAGTQHDLGRLLQGLGRLAEAAQAFEAASRLEPWRGEHHRRLAEVVQWSKGDPRLAVMERLERDLTGGPDRICLLFALGKAYADLGRDDEALARYLEACRGVRARLPYDEASTLAMFERMAALFTPALIRARAGQGDPSGAPVFILGMPRSGSTLVEQILGRHPDVVSGGELTLFRDLAAAMLGEPERVRTLDPAGFAAIGRRYAEAVRTLSPRTQGPGRARIIDKMPANFLMLGLIHLALPGARIIHTVRDPFDTCLSCFTTLFGDGQSWSYELGELGRHYRAYERLMQHWRAVIPAGVVLEVGYEAVVADLEGQARRMLDHCGLAWDPACLDFQRGEQPVWTASAAQVRRPLHTGAIGRWRRDAAVLRPLIEGLGPALAAAG